MPDVYDGRDLPGSRHERDRGVAPAKSSLGTIGIVVMSILAMVSGKLIYRTFLAPADKGLPSRHEERHQEQPRKPLAVGPQEEQAPREPTAREAWLQEVETRITQERAARAAPAARAGSGDPVRDALDREAEQRGRQEREWRARMARAQARVERAQGNVDVLVGASSMLSDSFVVTDKRGGRREVSTAELQRMRSQALSELDAAKRAVDDIEEQARRASIPPGWLR